MTMSSGNLLEFSAGGGGLIGTDQDCTLTNFRVAKHAFEKKDRATGNVIEQYETQCMLGFTLTVDEPLDDNAKEAEQWLPIGPLPGGDPKMPGGYLPSVDNETPAEEGPFILLDGRTDIWSGSQYATFMTELINLGLRDYADRIFSQGVSALNGLKAHMGTKALPKSKKAKADPNSKERTILVPTAINAWPWDAAATTAKPAAAKKSAPAAAKAAPAAAAAPAGDDAVTTRAIESIQAALAAGGGMLEFKALAGKVFPLTAKDGAARPGIVQKANNKDFLAEHSGTAWLFDADSATLMSLG